MKNYLITDHLYYSEVIHSEIAKRKGIENTPSDSQLGMIKIFAEKIIEPLATGCDTHLNFNSVFRSLALNKAIGGAKNSAHMVLDKWAAADIDNDGKPYGWASNDVLFRFAFMNLDFDQLIWESGSIYQPDWVHIGYSLKNNRHQVMRMELVDGKPKYFDISKIYKP